MTQLRAEKPTGMSESKAKQANGGGTVSDGSSDRRTRADFQTQAQPERSLGYNNARSNCRSSSGQHLAVPRECKLEKKLQDRITKSISTWGTTCPFANRSSPVHSRAPFSEHKSLTHDVLPPPHQISPGRSEKVRGTRLPVHQWGASFPIGDVAENRR